MGRGRQVAMWGPSQLLTKADNLTKIISSVVGSQLHYMVVGSQLHYMVVGSQLYYMVVGSLLYYMVVGSLLYYMGSRLHYTMAGFIPMISSASLMEGDTGYRGLHQLSDVSIITGQASTTDSISFTDYARINS